MGCVVSKGTYEEMVALRDQAVAERDQLSSEKKELKINNVQMSFSKNITKSLLKSTQEDNENLFNQMIDERITELKIDNEQLGFMKEAQKEAEDVSTQISKCIDHTTEVIEAKLEELEALKKQQQDRQKDKPPNTSNLPGQIPETTVAEKKTEHTPIDAEKKTEDTPIDAEKKPEDTPTDAIPDIVALFFDGNQLSDKLEKLAARYADDFEISFIGPFAGATAGLKMNKEKGIGAMTGIVASFPDFTFNHGKEQPQKASDGGWGAKITVHGTHTGSPFTPMPDVLPAIDATGKDCTIGPELFTMYTNEEGLATKLTIEPLSEGALAGPPGFYVLIGGTLPTEKPAGDETQP